MPTYEYRCEECGNEFSVSCRIADRNEQNCPVCHSKPKMVVSQGFTFGDEPVWLDDSVRNAIQDPKEAAMNPVISREQYKKILKEKDIVPLT